MTFCYYVSQAFNAYKSGVYNCAVESKVNHGMTLMGWGKEAGVEYWWLKNSWGAGWAQGGYAKIKLGPTATCNIYYVDASDAPPDLAGGEAAGIVDEYDRAIIAEVQLAWPGNKEVCVRQGSPGEDLVQTNYRTECARFRYDEDYGVLWMVEDSGARAGCMEIKGGAKRLVDEDACKKPAQSVKVVDEMYCVGDTCFDVYEYFLVLPPPMASFLQTSAVRHHASNPAPLASFHDSLQERFATLGDAWDHLNLDSDTPVALSSLQALL